MCDRSSKSIFEIRLSPLVAAFAFLFSAHICAADILYPPDAGVINIQSFGAKGDGVTDDTAAIQSAISAWTDLGAVLYFPDGTYLISSPLRYVDNAGNWGAYITIQGQNQSKTIFRLVDNAPGFQDPNNPEAVFFTASTSGSSIPSSPDYNPNGGGNEGFNNFFENLTVDVGSGNAGAVGIDFMANNVAGIRNVSIVSDDGSGAIALNIQRGNPGPMYIKYLTVKGFATAVPIFGSYGVWMEHIVLSGQTVAGINLVNGSLSIRDLRSDNTVPAVQIADWTGVASIDGATLTGGSPSVSAIELGAAPMPTLFLRAASSSGYQSLLSAGGQVLPGMSQAEWNSTAPQALFASPPPPALNLTVSETPVYSDTDFSHWANVENYGARPCFAVCSSIPDDTVGIQEAIDSGHTTVYLPPGDYGISRPIHLRGSVIHFLGIGGAALVPLPGFPPGHPAIFVDQTASGQVFFDSVSLIQNWWVSGNPSFPQPDLVDNARNTLIILDTDIAYGNTGAAVGATVFIENLNSTTGQLFNGQTVFARNLDPENFDPNPHVQVSGGKLWALGLKIEGPESTVLKVAEGALAEVMGLVASVWVDVAACPMILNELSSVSVSAYRTNPFVYSTGPTDYKVIAEEFLGGPGKLLYGSSTGRQPAAHPYSSGSAGSLFVGEMP